MPLIMKEEKYFVQHLIPFSKKTCSRKSFFNRLFLLSIIFQVMFLTQLLRSWGGLIREQKCFLSSLAQVLFFCFANIAYNIYLVWYLKYPPKKYTIMSYYAIGYFGAIALLGLIMLIIEHF